MDSRWFCTKMSDGEHRRFSPLHTWDEFYSEEPRPHWSSLMDIPHIHVCQAFIHCPPKQDFLNLMLFPSYSSFSCWLLSQIFPICLWNFHSLLSNPLLVALLWLNFVSATKILVLFFATLNPRCSYQPSSYLNSHHFHCYHSCTRQHHFLPKMIQGSINQASLLLPLLPYHALSTQQPEWSL